MRLPAFAFALCSAALPAAADPLVGGVRSDVALIDGWRQADGSRMAAVEFRLAPGWHTYWRVPGEAGIPPVFDWSGSKNLASVGYEWPRPEILDSYGFQSFGFTDRLVLPVRLVPRDPAAPLQLALSVSFGVCDDVCQPDEAEIAATLPPDAPPVGRSRIEAALAERPHGATECGVAAVTCRLVPDGDGYTLTAAVTFAADPGPGQAAAIEAGQPDLWIGAAESRTDGRTVTARAKVAATGGAGPLLERRALRLTVLDDDRAVDIHGCTAPG